MAQNALEVYTLSAHTCAVHTPTLALVSPAPACPLAQSLVPTAGCAFGVRLQRTVIQIEGWEPLTMIGVCLKDGVDQTAY